MRLEVKKYADRDRAHQLAVDYLERRVAGEINLVEPPSKVAVHQMKRLLASGVIPDTQNSKLKQEAALRGVSVPELKRLILEQAESTDEELLRIERIRTRLRKKLDEALLSREIELIRGEIDQAFAL